MDQTKWGKKQTDNISVYHISDRLSCCEYHGMSNAIEIISQYQRCSEIAGVLQIYCDFDLIFIFFGGKIRC